MFLTNPGSKLWYQYKVHLVTNEWPLERVNWSLSLTANTFSLSTNKIINWTASHQSCFRSDTDAELIWHIQLTSLFPKKLPCLLLRPTSHYFRSKLLWFDVLYLSALCQIKNVTKERPVSSLDFLWAEMWARYDCFTTGQKLESTFTASYSYEPDWMVFLKNIAFEKGFTIWQSWWQSERLQRKR